MYATWEVCFVSSECFIVIIFLVAYNFIVLLLVLVAVLACHGASSRPLLVLVSQEFLASISHLPDAISVTIKAWISPSVVKKNYIRQLSNAGVFPSSHLVRDLFLHYIARPFGNLFLSILMLLKRRVHNVDDPHVAYHSKRIVIYLKFEVLAWIMRNDWCCT